MTIEFTTAPRILASPEPDAESLAFWNAAREGRFLIKRCTACGRAHWFPRSICPFCWSAETVWEQATGRGTIYSYTIMRRAVTPYAVAYVELAEGPRMLTNIVCDDLDRLAIGQPVEVVLVPTQDPEGPPIPMFRPKSGQ